MVLLLQACSSEFGPPLEGNTPLSIWPSTAVSCEAVKVDVAIKHFGLSQQQTKTFKRIINHIHLFHLLLSLISKCREATTSCQTEILWWPLIIQEKGNEKKRSFLQKCVAGFTFLGGWKSDCVALHPYRIIKEACAAGPPSGSHSAFNNLTQPYPWTSPFHCFCPTGEN